MTLNAFHAQSAPQLGLRHSSATFQQSIPNSVWEQENHNNPTLPATASSNMHDIDTYMGDTEMDDHQDHQMEEVMSAAAGILNTENGQSTSQRSAMDQMRMLESARAALLRNSPSQAMAQHLLSQTSSQAMAQQLLNNSPSNSMHHSQHQLMHNSSHQGMLLNQQAASMGHSLMNNSQHGSSFGQQAQAAERANSLSSRSKTTPYNMKFMEQPNFMDQSRPPSAPNSTFQLGNQNFSAMSNGRNMFPQTLNSHPEHAQNTATNPTNNMFLNQMNQSIPSLLHSNGGHELAQSASVDSGVAAEIQALRLQREHAQGLSPNSPLMGGGGNPIVDSTISSDIQTLRLLRLSEEREKVQHRMRLQEQVEHLQMQNEVARRMRLQGDLDRQMQLQGEVDRLRLLNEVDRRMQMRNDVDHHLRMQNEARRLLIEKLARNGSQSFGP